MSTTFQPKWDMESMKSMNDDELVQHYADIKENLGMVDAVYLTEICARNLLERLN